MNSPIEQLMDRFNQMPRALRWASYAVFGVVLFLIWDSYVYPATLEMAQKADTIERQRDQVRNTPQLLAQMNDLRDAIMIVGHVAPPRDVVEGEGRFTNAVTDALKTHGIRDETFTLRRGGAFQSEHLYTVTGSRQTYRLTGELRFEAPPDVTMAVIADLESRPEVESLTQVNLTRASGRRLSVRIVLEAWIRPARVMAGGGIS